MDSNLLVKLSCDEFDAFESKIDSDYFGIRASKVLLKKACVLEEKQNDLLRFLDDFEFSSITNRLNDSFNNRWLGEKTTAFLTDMNIQLIKKISQPGHNDGNTVEISDKLPANDQIIQIAESAFGVSQFLNDPYLPREKARCIYADITRNAFGKSRRFFAVIQSGKTVKGFLLFSINHPAQMTIIELLAIDQEYKGQGIGKSLVRSVENYASSAGAEKIKVGTQVSNISALNFYISYGFKHLECNSIYHYWHSNT